MFPDPTVKWRPYRSIMDGMKAPPLVSSKGMWQGALNLIVVECAPGVRAYRVEITDVQAYAAVEEMVYSIADHSDKSGMYNGGIYIKEAIHSRLLTTFEQVYPVQRKARHFSFVGGDYCYEVLGFTEPTVHTFATPQEAYAWQP